jgi:hypothetical protein
MYVVKLVCVYVIFFIIMSVAQNSYQPNIYDQGTNLTPRTVDGKPDRNIATARVLPQSTNPRQGWKKTMYGEENQQLKAELDHPNRMLKSVIMDESGFIASVSDTSSSKIASYDIDIEKYPHAAAVEEDEFSGNDSGDEINSNVENNSKEDEHKDDDTGLRHEGKNDDESFKYKISSAKSDGEADDGTSVLSGASSTSTSSSSSSDQDGVDGPAFTINRSMKKTYQRSDINRSQSMALFSSMLDTVTEKSSWEIGSVDDKSLASTLNPGGEKARAMNDDTIFDAKEAMETCGAPNKRQVHSLDLRSVYETYGVAGEPLYTTSTPDESNYRGVACKDYIFFTARPLNATKLLSIPSLSQMSCDDPRESIICPDPYWYKPPKVFEEIFNKHEEKSLVGKKLAKLEKLQERDVEGMMKKLDIILRDNDGRVGTKMWGGTWVPFPTQNLKRTNCWLPNEAFASSHIALCAHFQIDKDNKATEWR